MNVRVSPQIAESDVKAIAESLVPELAAREFQTSGDDEHL